MQHLTPEQTRILGGAARYVSHRNWITVAAAVDAINKHPDLLQQVAHELADLMSALGSTIGNEIVEGLEEVTQRAESARAD